MKNLCVILAMVILLTTSCEQIEIDPYEASWKKVSVGMKRTELIEIMGSPSSISSFELPLIAAEEITWKPHLIAKRVYKVNLVLNKVITKSVSDN